MEHWEKVLAVERMQAYIDQHLSDRITLKDLAAVADYSPWHSSRIFKDLTGKNPFDYIRSLRLSRAAEILKEGETKIIDVALDFEFDSHEGFTRAFSRQFGMTPKDYRKSTPPLKFFIPTYVRDYYLKLQRGELKMTQNTNANTVFVQIIERPARKLILKRGIKATHYFDYCQEVGCEIWNILSDIKEALYEPIGMWLPEKFRTQGTSVYAQGVEVPFDFNGVIPTGYEIIDLPPCKMMYFQGPPYEDEKFETAIGDLWEVMKRYKPEIAGYEWADEDGPRFQLIPLGYRGYIEARPVRQISK